MLKRLLVAMLLLVGAGITDVQADDDPDSPLNTVSMTNPS